MRNLMNKIRSKKGQGTVEYALITLAVVGIIAAVLLVANNPLQTAIEGAFDAATAAIDSAATT